MNKDSASKSDVEQIENRKFFGSMSNVGVEHTTNKN